MIVEKYQLVCAKVHDLLFPRWSTLSFRTQILELRSWLVQLSLLVTLTTPPHPHSHADTISVSSERNAPKPNSVVDTRSQAVFEPAPAPPCVSLVTVRTMGC